MSIQRRVCIRHDIAPPSSIGSSTFIIRMGRRRGHGHSHWHGDHPHGQGHHIITSPGRGGGGGGHGIMRIQILVTRGRSGRDGKGGIIDDSRARVGGWI